MESKRVFWPGWETTRLIGRGSFGAVYEIERRLFEDEEPEKAALKIITIPQNDSDIAELYSDGYDEESVTSTFRSHLKSIVAEYSLMRKMNGSSNIVNCDDVRYVQHDDGIGWDIYIKMELLTPLAKALPATVSEEQVIKIAKDMCAALELCQKNNIIHRDIKPQNIFVSENGDYKLGDFGIAKTVEKTMGGTKTGTYKYMAPEVYSNRPYNSTADIYSLGLVLYWLLNERRMPFMPLPPEKLRAGMDEESRNRRFSGEKIPAPKNGSEKLKKIVLKACAFDPKERYQTAREMRKDLQHYFNMTTPESEIASDDNSDQGLTDDATVGLVFHDGTTVGMEKQEQTITLIPSEANEQDETVGPDFSEKIEKKSDQKTNQKKRIRSVLAIAACLVAVIFLALSMMPKRNAAELPKDSNAGQMTEPKAVIQETVGKFRYALISDSIPPDEPYGYGYTYPAFGGKYLRPQISSITFLASIEDAVDSWDVSENQDGTVLAWVEPNGNLYDLYIGAEGGVMAPKNCESLFAYYVNVESIDFNGCFNTCSVRDMNNMFANCEKLARLDLQSFNTGKVRNMYGMFEHCMNLVSLDVSNFDTSNVDLMFNMFSYCERLLELDVSMFDTSNVSNMCAMFQGCASLRSLDLTNFDTSNVWDMRYMFEYCNPEIELDVSSFDVTYVTEYEHFMPSGMKVNGRPWEEFFNKY